MGGSSDRPAKVPFLRMNDISHDKCNVLRKDGTLVWDKPWREWFDYHVPMSGEIPLVHLGVDLYRLDDNGTAHKIHL